MRGHVNCRYRTVSMNGAFAVAILVSWMLPIVVGGFGLHGAAIRMTAASSSMSAQGSAISLNVLAKKKILVVGGSGRVGGSVVTQLAKHQAQVTVGGTNPDSFEATKYRWRTRELFANAQDVRFAKVDKEDASSISAVLLQNEKYDLVVHTAGPFQGKENVRNGVLEACIVQKVPYIDVCDDYCTAMAAKSKFSKPAEENGVPCIISTGCWVSTLFGVTVEYRCIVLFHKTPPFYLYL